MLKKKNEPTKKNFGRTGAVTEGRKPKERRGRRN